VTDPTLSARRLEVAGVATAVIDTGTPEGAAAPPELVRRLVLMGSVGVAMALPPGLDTVWGYTPGIEQMRQVIALFAHNRDLVTDELVELRYRASISPPVRDAWEAMFPSRGNAGWTTWRCPAPSWRRSGRRSCWCTAATTAWCPGGARRRSSWTCSVTRGCTSSPAAGTGR
jgi:hypothetical protein